jgi:hypothetical protein
MQQADVPSGVRAMAAGVEKQRQRRRTKAVAARAARRPGGTGPPWRRLLLLPFLFLLLASILSMAEAAAEVASLSLSLGVAREGRKDRGLS